MDELFLVTASKKFLRLYTDYKRGVKQSNKQQTLKRQILSISELLQEHIRACLSIMCFDGSDLEEV